MIKNIIFDLGGVLLDVDMKRCFQQFKNLGVNPELFTSNNNSPNAQESTICEGMSASGIIALYQTGDISTTDFINTIQKACFPNTTYDQVLNAWNSCLFSIPQKKLEVVKQLHEKYNTYMLSNTNEAHWEYIYNNSFPTHKPDLSLYFNKVFLSQEMHLAKPNPQIYKEMLKAIDATPSECLFIDDASANTIAAENLGIKTLTVEASKINEQGNIIPPAHDWCNIIHEELQP
ncbi:MAG: HAD family phosphatase [Prevotellaceae bacterium]|nr:HAD family phosphatase [Candidatus Minthosoma caballi]